MASLTAFTKPALTLDQQLDLLKQRGLSVCDDAAARHALRYIGYYRLSGYALPFQMGGPGPTRHYFRPGTHFDQIVDRYVFDRKLRLHVMDAIERIEISARALLSNTLAAAAGPHWYTTSNVFEAGFGHQAYLEDIKRQISFDPQYEKNRDVHIAHYFKNYSTPELPPCWMVFESVSFGTVSKTYKFLKSFHGSELARGFGLPRQVLSSWLHSINYVRNICAHHARLWNRTCRIEPMTAHAYAAELTQQKKIYAHLAVMQILLKQISPDSQWAEKLQQLLASHPDIPRHAMGFRSGWEQGAIWR